MAKMSKEGRRMTNRDGSRRMRNKASENKMGVRPASD